MEKIKIKSGIFRSLWLARVTTLLFIISTTFGPLSPAWAIDSFTEPVSTDTATTSGTSTTATTTSTSTSDTSPTTTEALQISDSQVLTAVDPSMPLEPGISPEETVTRLQAYRQELEQMTITLLNQGQTTDDMEERLGEIRSDIDSLTSGYAGVIDENLILTINNLNTLIDGYRAATNFFEPVQEDEYRGVIAAASLEGTTPLPVARQAIVAATEAVRNIDQQIQNLLTEMENSWQMRVLFWNGEEDPQTQSWADRYAAYEQRIRDLETQRVIVFLTRWSQVRLLLPVLLQEEEPFPTNYSSVGIRTYRRAYLQQVLAMLRGVAGEQGYEVPPLWKITQLRRHAVRAFQNSGPVINKNHEMALVVQALDLAEVMLLGAGSATPPSRTVNMNLMNLQPGGGGPVLASVGQSIPGQGLFRQGWRQIGDSHWTYAGRDGLFISEDDNFSLSWNVQGRGTARLQRADGKVEAISYDASTSWTRQIGRETVTSESTGTRVVFNPEEIRLRTGEIQRGVTHLGQFNVLEREFPDGKKIKYLGLYVREISDRGTIVSYDIDLRRLISAQTTEERVTTAYFIAQEIVGVDAIRDGFIANSMGRTEWLGGRGIDWTLGQGGVATFVGPILDFLADVRGTSSVRPDSLRFSISPGSITSLLVSYTNTDGNRVFIPTRFGQSSYHPDNPNRVPALADHNTNGRRWYGLWVQENSSMNSSEQVVVNPYAQREYLLNNWEFLQWSTRQMVESGWDLGFFSSSVTVTERLVLLAQRTMLDGYVVEVREGVFVPKGDWDGVYPEVVAQRISVTNSGTSQLAQWGSWLASLPVISQFCTATGTVSRVVYHEIAAGGNALAILTAEDDPLDDPINRRLHAVSHLLRAAGVTVTEVNGQISFSDPEIVQRELNVLSAQALTYLDYIIREKRRLRTLGAGMMPGALDNIIQAPITWQQRGAELVGWSRLGEYFALVAEQTGNSWYTVLATGVNIADNIAQDIGTILALHILGRMAAAGGAPSAASNAGITGTLANTTLATRAFVLSYRGLSASVMTSWALSLPSLFVDTFKALNPSAGYSASQLADLAAHAITDGLFLAATARSFTNTFRRNTSSQTHSALDQALDAISNPIIDFMQGWRAGTTARLRNFLATGHLSTTDLNLNEQALRVAFDLAEVRRQLAAAAELELSPANQANVTRLRQAHGELLAQLADRVVRGNSSSGQNTRPPGPQQSGEPVPFRDYMRRLANGDTLAMNPVFDWVFNLATEGLRLEEWFRRRTQPRPLSPPPVTRTWDIGTAEPTIQNLINFLQTQSGQAVRLIDTLRAEGFYSSVYLVNIGGTAGPNGQIVGGRNVVVKMAGGMLGGEQARTLLRELDLNALSRNMPGLPRLFETEVAPNGSLLAVVVEYVNGVPLNLALDGPSPRISPQEAVNQLNLLLEQFERFGLRLTDTNDPANFVVQPNGRIRLIDAGSFANPNAPPSTPPPTRRQLIERILSSAGLSDPVIQQAFLANVPPPVPPNFLQRLLGRAQPEIGNNDLGGGIIKYLEGDGANRAHQFLPTANITAADLPYRAELRTPAPLENLPQSLDLVPRVRVNLPVTDTFLVSGEHSGSAGVVRMGILPDGRPVALKSYYGNDGNLAADNNALLADYRGARIAENMGIGPRTLGFSIDPRLPGRLWLVTDIVPGDSPTSAAGSGFINEATVRDLIHINRRLVVNNRTMGGDFQYLVTREGRIQVIDAANLSEPATPETLAFALEDFTREMVTLLTSVSRPTPEATTTARRALVEMIANDLQNTRIIGDLHDYLSNPDDPANQTPARVELLGIINEVIQTMEEISFFSAEDVSVEDLFDDSMPEYPEEAYFEEFEEESFVNTVLGDDYDQNVNLDFESLLGWWNPIDVSTDVRNDILELIEGYFDKFEQASIFGLELTNNDDSTLETSSESSEEGTSENYYDEGTDRRRGLLWSDLDYGLHGFELIDLEASPSPLPIQEPTPTPEPTPEPEPAPEPTPEPEPTPTPMPTPTPEPDPTVDTNLPPPPSGDDGGVGGMIVQPPPPAGDDGGVGGMIIQPPPKPGDDGGGGGVAGIPNIILAPEGGGGGGGAAPPGEPDLALPPNFLDGGGGDGGMLPQPIDGGGGGSVSDPILRIPIEKPAPVPPPRSTNPPPSPTPILEPIRGSRPTDPPPEPSPTPMPEPIRGSRPTPTPEPIPSVPEIPGIPVIDPITGLPVIVDLITGLPIMPGMPGWIWGIDPITGLPGWVWIIIDPVTGLPIDPITGLPVIMVDPITGLPIIFPGTPSMPIPPDEPDEMPDESEMAIPPG